jgi:hypothetical protein
VNAESSLKIFQLKRQKLWLDQNGVKTNSKWIEPKRESVCLKVLYFGLKDRKCFSHLTPLPYYLISLLVYLLYGVGSTTCIYFIIYCITTEFVWPPVSILSFITLLRSQFYHLYLFYHLLNYYGVDLTTCIYFIIYCMTTELLWPPISILSFIALLRSWFDHLYLFYHLLHYYGVGLTTCIYFIKVALPLISLSLCIFILAFAFLQSGFAADILSFVS